jgi:hypothetical protein
MLDLVKSAARRMMADFEDSRDISHNATKGRAREFSVLENFLEPYLPARYSVGSGVIMDVEEDSSKQQDLVVYDEFYSPVLMSMGSENLFFPESIYSVLEVKSTLRSRDIEDIVAKSASVWNLTKAPNREVQISPGVTMPALSAPSLCAGICFESEVAVEDIAPKIREARGGIDNGHALSILCVLSDQNDDAGLVINVSEDNLRSIVLIPEPSSRLALIECDSAGDALLYMYLMLMEHLRHSGRINPGPDLLRYAEMADLGIPKHQMSTEELEGASLQYQGQKLEMDTMQRVRALTEKVMGEEQEATDEEILEWFSLIPEMPHSEHIRDPRTIFVENGEELDLPGTAKVLSAIENYRSGSPDEEEEKIVKNFISLIRSLRPQNRGIEMIIPE